MLNNNLKQANESKEEQKRRKELIQRKRDYYKLKCSKSQQRINKAIEYIKEKYHEDLYDETLVEFNNNLLEILKGEDTND